MQAILAGNARSRATRTRTQTPALLKGPDLRSYRGGDVADAYETAAPTLPLLCQPVSPEGGQGSRLPAPPHSSRPAGEIEAGVIVQVRGLLVTPEVVIGAWRAARSEIEDLAEEDVRQPLARLEPLWDELFPAEQARIIQLLVERVDVGLEGADIRLRVEGLASIAKDLAAIGDPDRRAAA